MKHSRVHDDEPVVAPRQTKRLKSVQACQLCRKNKARCEILEKIPPDAAVKCHRCRVLNVSCSYSEMDRNLFQSYFISTNAMSEDSERVRSEIEEFPVPQNMWDRFVKPRGPIDWHQPLIAIQELVKQPFRSSTPLPPFADQSLDSILTGTQKEELLNLFNFYYIPWMNIELISESDRNNSLLEAVCCTIASRHMTYRDQALVAARLQKLTEDKIVKVIFDPRSAESLESVQALLILSLWSPIGGVTESGIRDGRMLISSAVNMAMNLRLHQASEQVSSMRKAQSENSASVDDGELERLTNRARLWACLTNNESFLCTGTARLPFASRTDSDRTLFQISGAKTVKELRDLRIRLFSELFTVSEKARTIRFQKPEQLDNWYDNIVEVTGLLQDLKRVALALTVASPHDKAQFHMLMLILNGCHFLVLYHAYINVRAVYAETPLAPRWFHEVRPHGTNAISSVWGRDILGLGVSVLVSTLQVDAQFLSTSPDHLFNMITVAAGFIIAIKHHLIENINEFLEGAEDALFETVIQHLERAALSSDHSANRCRQLIASIYATWQRRRDGLHEEDPGLHYVLPAIPIELDKVAPEVTSGMDWSNGNTLQDTDHDFWSAFFVHQ